MSGNRRTLLLGTSFLLSSIACTSGDTNPNLEDITADPTTEMGLDINQDRIVVGFHDRTPPRVASFLGELPVQALHSGARLGRISVPHGTDATELVTALREGGEVRFAELDRVRTISTMQINDPAVGYQWNLDQVGASAAWDQGADGAGTIVAVIDTGVSPGGPDGLHLSVGEHAGWDFVDGDADPSDGHGHGTHVAGTVAQNTGNGVGVAGLAHGAEVMAVRVLDDNGSGYSSDVANGILWAVDHGADVINLSLGSTIGSQAEQDAVEYASEMGVLVIAATGNEYRSNGVSYPAAYDSVMAVGASNGIDQVVSYSNRGPEVEIVAPGGDFDRDDDGNGMVDGIIQETIISGTWDYYFFQGTSMASPHVAGAAAILVGMGADSDEAREILTETSVDIADSGIDTTSGWGRLDVGEAVAELDARLDEPDFEDPVHEDPVEDGTDPDEPDWDDPDLSEPDPGDLFDEDGRPVDPDPGNDFTAPVITWVRAHRDGPVAIVQVWTDEVAGVMICEQDTLHCARSPYGEEHSLRLRTHEARLDILARDPSGNVRVIPLDL